MSTLDHSIRIQADTPSSLLEADFPSGGPGLLLRQHLPLLIARYYSIPSIWLIHLPGERTNEKTLATALALSHWCLNLLSANPVVAIE